MHSEVAEVRQCLGKRGGKKVKREKEQRTREKETKEGGGENVILMGRSEGWDSYPSKVWSWQVILEKARRAPSDFLVKNRAGIFPDSFLLQTLEGALNQKGH